jgi:signal transduction histidine kinase
MGHGNVLSGSAFRAALNAVAAVITALIVTGVAAYLYVQATLQAELTRQISAEEVMLHQIYDEGGLPALITTINEVNNPATLSPRAIGLFDPLGTRLAGNLQVLPSLSTSPRLALTTTDPSAQQTDYYLSASLIDNVTLVLGRDLSLITAAERTLILAFSVAGVVLTATILLIGYAASRASLRKLEVIQTTMDHVSQGDMGVRVPISRDYDQIDRVSERINRHLDRLSTLMVSTRTTAAAIAHDLRTPLSRAFLSLQDAAARLDKGQDPREAIDRTDAELSRLGRIFDAILRISRIETQGDRKDFTAVNLAPLLEDLVETFAPVAEEKGQTIRFLTAANVPAVTGDDRMLRQLVVNLIQNAVTHTPEGTEITVALKRLDRGVEVSVSDNGPGIPEADRSKVIEPFYRVDGHKTTEGSGLGLALVKAIAERHGSALTLQDNAPGLKVSLVFPFKTSGGRQTPA